jgi:hypothetical protein
MQRFVDEPELAARLGARGYLYSESGDVPDDRGHVREVERLYEQVLKPHAQRASHPASAGPWRITFDTNPDTCNLRCVMCEEHSPHSLLQIGRKEEGRPRRLMPFELIERVVADAAPHGLREIIPSTMGEPLLYEHFEGILDLCRRHGVKLNLTTNGTFPRLGAGVGQAHRARHVRREDLVERRDQGDPGGDHAGQPLGEGARQRPRRSSPSGTRMRQPAATAAGSPSSSPSSSRTSPSWRTSCASPSSSVSIA